MNRLSGMEECLRLFTNVEVLDNKNMVGCQRCWKIANQEREREASRENSDEHEDWTDDNEESSSEEEDEVGFPKSPASLLGPAQTLAMPPEEYVQHGGRGTRNVQHGGHGPSNGQRGRTPIIVKTLVLLILHFEIDLRGSAWTS
jgi:hypothetical protein